MRVIAGEFRSRQLVAPAGLATRPTSDRLRETLFNVLGARVAGSRFADLYAGSGAVGIEAVSRGAGEVWLVEKAPPAIAAAKKNIDALGIAARVRLESRGVKAFLDKADGFDFVFPRFDFVFLDPPYEAEAEYALTLAALGRSDKILADGAVVVAEHARRYELAEQYGKLRRSRVLLQGDAGLSFYSVDEEEKLNGDGQ